MSLARRTLLAAALTGAVLGLSALPATGAVPQDTAEIAWHEIGGPPQSAAEQIGYLREFDGTLLIAWANRGTLWISKVSPGGTPSPPVAVLTGWVGINTPAIVQNWMSEALEVFFGGIHSQSASDPNRDLNVATSTDGGATWSTSPVPVSSGGDYAYTSPITAIWGDGDPIEAWASGSGLFVHYGLSPATPNSEYQHQVGDVGAILPRLVQIPGSGGALAWLSSRPLGIYVQRLDWRDGTPVGTPSAFPGLVQDNSVNSMLNPVPLAIRVGDGALFTTYRGGGSAGNTVRVWGVGQPTSQLFVAARRGAAATHPTIAADRAGRLWLAYAAQHSARGMALTTQRSAPGTGKATFGARVVANLPVAGFPNILGVEASPRGDVLDVIATVLTPADRAFHTFVGTVHPGLALHVKVIPVGGGHLLHCLVTDAGVPVEGATVKVLGSTLTTAKDGMAPLVTTKSGTHEARASKAGYVAATARVKL